MVREKGPYVEHLFIDILFIDKYKEADNNNKYIKYTFICRLWFDMSILAKFKVFLELTLY